MGFTFNNLLRLQYLKTSGQVIRSKCLNTGIKRDLQFNNFLDIKLNEISIPGYDNDIGNIMVKFPKTDNKFAVLKKLFKTKQKIIRSQQRLLVLIHLREKKFIEINPNSA